MRLLKVGCAALNQTPLDWEGNRDRIVAVLECAHTEGVQVLCLPELVISGYGCEDLFLSPDVQRTALEVLDELLPYTKGLVVGFGLPLYVNNDCYDAVALVANGVLHGFALKQFLARDGLYYETRWFRAWPAGEQASVRIGAKEFPVGDLVFQLVNDEGKSCALGFEICEDAWSASRPGSRLAARGAQIVLNPSASHFAFDRFNIRKRFVLEGSRAFGVAYLYANLLGNEAGRVIYDGSCFIASGGQLAAQGERFGFGDHTFTTATVDLDLSIVSRQRSADASVLEGVPSPNTTRVPAIVQVPAPWQLAKAKSSNAPIPAWESAAEIRFEEFARAQALGLFDYIRKSSSRGAVVSLSGGADSSVVVCLLRLMVELSESALGFEAMKQRLGNWTELAASADIPAAMKALLMTVYQSTENSSEITRDAALKVAEAVGSMHVEWSVQDSVSTYRAIAEKALGSALTWEKDDVALQNIQARARSPGVWLLANVRQALLLSTSNRSEVAVGYATMDGDTAGGLAPLGGIDKAFIRRWLEWLCVSGLEGFAPIPALKVVTEQSPTAELRPPGAKQTDEADLMPYEVLNLIELGLVQRGYSPSEILENLKQEQGNKYSSEDLQIWVDRFCTLFSRNQWKRERYAPSFHMDGYNLDPRSYYRFPILSGGFVREKARLRRAGPTKGC